jgi:restriction system protein
MTRRTMKMRLPRPIGVGLGLTILWLGMAFLFVMDGGLRGNGNWLTVFLVTIMVIGAWVGIVWLQRKQNAADKTLADLQAMSPDAFEEWVAARFRDRGYSVDLTGSQGDHGVDLVGRRKSETVVIQCKNYRIWSVGEPKLRDLYGAMHDFSADRAFLVTTGELSGPARAWIVGKPIDIWDGAYLQSLSTRPARTPALGENASRRSVGDSNSTMENMSRVADAPVTEATPSKTATCPKCGSTLVQRQNRQTSESFWGCASYPKCKYTKPLGTATPASSGT